MGLLQSAHALALVTTSPQVSPLGAGGLAVCAAGQRGCAFCQSADPDLVGAAVQRQWHHALGAQPHKRRGCRAAGSWAGLRAVLADAGAAAIGAIAQRHCPTPYRFPAQRTTAGACVCLHLAPGSGTAFVKLSKP